MVPNVPVAGAGLFVGCKGRINSAYKYTKELGEARREGVPVGSCAQVSKIIRKRSPSMSSILAAAPKSQASAKKSEKIRSRVFLKNNKNRRKVHRKTGDVVQSRVLGNSSLGSRLRRDRHCRPLRVLFIMLSFFIFYSLFPTILIASMSKSALKRFAAPVCSMIFPSTILSIFTPVTFIIFPVGLIPIHSPRCVPVIV